MPLRQVSTLIVLGSGVLCDEHTKLIAVAFLFLQTATNLPATL